MQNHLLRGCAKKFESNLKLKFDSLCLYLLIFCREPQFDSKLVCERATVTWRGSRVLIRSQNLSTHCRTEVGFLLFNHGWQKPAERGCVPHSGISGSASICKAVSCKFQRFNRDVAAAAGAVRTAALRSRKFIRVHLCPSVV